MNDIEERISYLKTEVSLHLDDAMSEIRMNNFSSAQYYINLAREKVDKILELKIELEVMKQIP